jgi:multiple sugar transport system permease protein
VAISIVFLFLFTGSGVVNELLGFIGIDGPTWFADPRGLLHLLGDAVGVWDLGSPPDALTGTSILGLSAWQWLSGPSVALSVIIMLVVWTTTGTFMLMFLARCRTSRPRSRKPPSWTARAAGRASRR